MTRINDLLTNAQNGLMPYLQARINDNFARLIVRQYTFGSTSQRTGYRIRSIQTGADSARSKTRTAAIVIGKLVDIATDQDYQIVGADFANSLADAIAEWSRCKAIGLKAPISTVDANLTVLQNPAQPSQNSTPSAWAIAVVLSFQMEYVD